MTKSDSSRAPGAVLTTYPCGETDILAAFLDWHLEVVQVPLILALDVTPPEDPDAIAEIAHILNEADQRYPGRLIWRRAAETRNMRSPDWQVGDRWAQLAAAEYAASWVIHCDIDEFVVVPDREPISVVLERASECGYTVLPLHRYTMTGRAPLDDDYSLSTLRVRIDQQTTLSARQMIDAAISPLEHPLPVPFPFVDVGPHLAVASSAFSTYQSGNHGISPSHGETALLHDPTSNPTSPYILTWPTRSRAQFDKRIWAAREFLAANDHLEPSFAWHWRRLVSLADSGSAALDAEFAAQFLSLSALADGLLLDRDVHGHVPPFSIDSSVADFIVEQTSTRQPR